MKKPKQKVKKQVGPVREKDKVGVSYTFSRETTDKIDEIASKPQYRNNKSFVVESILNTSKEFKKIKSKK